MNDRHDMTERLQLLHELYEGDLDGTMHRDDAVDQELRSYRDLKDLLDARPPRRPDPATMDAVLAVARDESVPHLVRSASSVSWDGRVRSVQPVPRKAGNPSRREDRSPERRFRPTSLRVGVLSGLVVLLVASVGLFQLNLLRFPISIAPTSELTAESADPRGSESPRTLASESEAREDGESFESRSLSDGTRDIPLAGSDVPLAARELSRAERDVGLSGYDFPPIYAVEATAAGDPLAWDEREDVIDVYEDIRMIGSAVNDGWEPPSVPLEMFPPDTRGRGSLLQPAGQRRP